MRITDLKTFVVGNPWKNWLFAQVETDEGVHGIGEGTLMLFKPFTQDQMHRSVAAVISSPLEARVA